MFTQLLTLAAATQPSIETASDGSLTVTVPRSAGINVQYLADDGSPDGDPVRVITADEFARLEARVLAQESAGYAVASDVASKYAVAAVVEETYAKSAVVNAALAGLATDIQNRTQQHCPALPQLNTGVLASLYGAPYSPGIPGLLGSVANFSCVGNGTLSGDSERVCAITGGSPQWSGSPASCAFPDGEHPTSAVASCTAAYVAGRRGDGPYWIINGGVLSPP